MAKSSHTLEVIDIPEHCGNAPRKAVLRDFLLALYQGDSAQVLEHLRDDIAWEIVGTTVLEGHKAVESWLATQRRVFALHLTTVITHGTDCGADGRVVHDDSAHVAFNHVVIFAGHAKTAKIKAIRSYLVSLD